jgi:hypothetical protein
MQAMAGDLTNLLWLTLRKESACPWMNLSVCSVWMVGGIRQSAFAAVSALLSILMPQRRGSGWTQIGM